MYHIISVSIWIYQKQKGPNVAYITELNEKL